MLVLWNITYSHEFDENVAFKEFDNMIDRMIYVRALMAFEGETIFYWIEVSVAALEAS